MRRTARVTLTEQDRRVLAWAVREAAIWRGSMIGNPDPIPLLEFDKKVYNAKQVLLKIFRALSREGKQ